MNATRSILAATAIALALGAATVAARAEVPAKAQPAPTAQVYRVADKFVVAIFKAEGNVTLAVVEPPARRRGRNAGTPDVDDLMQNGRVTYSIDLPAADTAPAGAAATLAGPPAANAGAGPAARKRPHGFAAIDLAHRRLIARETKAAAQALSVVAKQLAAR